MTNKEFFLAQIKKEKPVFLSVIKALPEDKYDFKPNEKARDAGNIAAQLALQPVMMLMIATTGLIDSTKNMDMPKLDFDTIIPAAEKNFDDMEKSVASVTDNAWESENGVFLYKGGKWEDKKFEMAWGFLFDAIHHRGQLSTYLRAMGAKVPSIYGGSADVPAA
jgi:hypothetical protein